jgi:hypothetical protein
MPSKFGSKRRAYMGKKETSCGDRSGRPPTFGILPLARSWGLVLLTGLCLTVMQATAFGDPACFFRCQQELSQCLQLAQGDPMEEARCQDEYDACGEACMLQ